MTNQQSVFFHASLQIMLMGFFIFVHFVHLPSYDGDERNRVDGQRIATTNDAFYFLHQTQYHLSGNYGAEDSLRGNARPAPAPLIVTLTASLHRLTGIKIETLAFFLPVFFGSLCIPVMWRSAEAYMPDSTSAPVICCLAATLSPAFFIRSRLGYFDTDGLNLVLVWGMMLGTILINSRDKAARTAGVLWFGACAVLLCLWWEPAGIPIVLLLSATTAAGMVRKSKTGIVLTAVLCTIVAWGMFAVHWNRFDLLPEFSRSVLRSLGHHIDLVLHADTTRFFETGSTIAELKTPHAQDWKILPAGSWSALAVAVFGMSALLYSRTKTRIILGIPLVVFCFLAFRAERFMMFITPFVATGIAFTYYIFRNSRISGFAIKPAVFILCLLILYPAFDICRTSPLKPAYEKSFALMAQSLQVLTPQNAKIWNWWPTGYYLQYYGERKTFIDEGSQSPYRSYAAAFPLVQRHPVISGNWIRFFLKRQDGLHHIKKITGSYDSAVNVLLKIFEHPDKLKTILHELDFPENRDWYTYFFPPEKAYLVLFSDMLVKNSWLSIGATMPDSKDILDVTVFSLQKHKAVVNLDSGEIHYDGDILPFSRIHIISKTELRSSKGKESDYAAVLIEDSDRIFYIPEEYFDCLAYRLLFTAPETTPGFKKIMYHPYVGGIWEVLPPQNGL